MTDNFSISHFVYLVVLAHVQMCPPGQPPNIWLPQALLDGYITASRYKLHRSDRRSLPARDFR